MDVQHLYDLVEKSGKTDLAILLQAKEEAKRAVAQDASEKNAKAFTYFSRLVENAMTATKNLKNWTAVLEYVKENGRKLGKTKLFDDIGKARLKREPDGTFLLKNVDRYMVTLPGLGTSDVEASAAADRQKRREEAEIRRITAQADKEELALFERRGQLVGREEVLQMLAARAVTLDSDLKSAIAVRASELISKVDGDPRKIKNLITDLEEILDEAFAAYAKTDEIEVLFKAPAEGFGDDEEEELS